MKTVCSAALALLLAVSGAVAQEAPAEKPEAKPEAKAPFAFTCTGDTVDNFKVSIVVNQKVDQSTARGAVEAYLGFTDSRDETRKAHDATGKRWDELAAKSLAPWEEKLLTSDARAALADARKAGEADDPAKSRVAPASEVTGETKAEDGSVLIETLQKITDKFPDKTGKMNDSTREEKQRFTCAKGEDGKWRINKMETWNNHYDPETREQKWAWKEGRGLIGFFYMMTSEEAPEPAELKQDTPENAALSLYNTLLMHNELLSYKARSMGMPQWLKEIEALLSPAFIEGTKKELAEFEGMGGKVKKTASGTEAATDGKDGAKLVKIKKSSEWRPVVQVTLKQVDGKWMVAEAGTYENKGGIDTGPQYRAMANIYKLPAP